MYRPLRPSRLAATAIICLSFGMNTHAGAANTICPVQPVARPAPGSAAVIMQVLSLKDEERYRAIFAAQAKNDWKRADSLVEGLKDHGLVGHVLADRYERRTPTIAELTAWLAT